MKLKSAILAVSLLAFVASAAHAGQWSTGLTGGAGMPTGDYGKVAGTGWNIGGSVNNMVNSNWGIGADLGYHSWGGSNDYNSALQVVTGDPSAKGSFSAIQATGHAMYNIPTSGNVHPYFKAGVGLYNVKAKLESTTGNADNSWSKLGYNFGAGMNFATQGSMTWGFGGAYHIVQTKNDLGVNTNMFTVGLNLNFGMGK